MLKDNSKRLPFLNHNWKRLNLTITKNWIRFWIIDIQSEVFTIQYEHNRLYFSRHLRILRFEQLEEFSKLLMFCFQRFSTKCWPFVWYSIVLHVYLFSKSSSLFIEYLRDVGNLAIASTCLVWSFDSSPLIFFLIWYLSYEELISNPFLFQRNNVCSNVIVIFVLIWRQVSEKVVAETSTELVVVHFVHCPLSTLVKELLMGYASDDPCFWWRVFRSSSSDPLLQTQFFRRILPDALSFK